MLEIVAKRAALRSFDTNATQHQASSSTVSATNHQLASVSLQQKDTSFESDVSGNNNLLYNTYIMTALRFCFNRLKTSIDFSGWVLLFCQFFILYACILYYAFSRT